MSIQHITLVIGGIVVLAALIFGVSYLQQPTASDTDITYVLESVKDGSFEGGVPPLDYVPEFSASIPESVQTLLNKKIQTATEQLTERPYDGNVWMDLALNYHQGNDFVAAERVWLFLSEATPNNVTVLGNLGRLYHFEYKDFPKAEEYFKKAIAANPDRTDAYFDLFDLYRYSYKKDTTAAVDIMKVGAEKFPDDINFPAGLGTYYRDTGRPNQARAQFEKALDMARTVGDVNLIQSFTGELSRL